MRKPIYLSSLTITFLISIILLLSTVKNIYPQSRDINFENISLSEGLPHSNINHITQDKFGFIWMCSPAGLIRYDGYEFIHYTPDPNDSTSIGSSFVYMSLSDHLGNLWIASYDGLYRFDYYTESFEGFFHNEDDPASLVTNGIYTLFEDSEGTLWLGTAGHGMEKFERESKSFVHYRYDPNNDMSLSSDAVNMICEDLLGNLWVGTSNGLNKFDRKNGQFNRFYNEPGNPSSIPDNRITKIILDHSGMLWIASWTGLTKYDPYQNVFRRIIFETDQQLGNGVSRIIDIIEDNDNNIWIGTDYRGIRYFNRKTNTLTGYLNDPNDAGSLCGDRILSLFEDRSGVIWIGTFLQGICKLNSYDKTFQHYEYSAVADNSLSNNFVRTILELDDGKVWIGTDGSGIDIFDPAINKFTNFRNNPSNPQSIGSNRISNIYEDRDGTIWIGTYGGGLNKLLNKNNPIPQFKRFIHDPEDPASLSNNNIHEIYEDSRGNLWIGTSGGGLNLFNKSEETFKHFRYDPNDNESIAEDMVMEIFEDSKGDFWIGTDQRGFDLFDRETEKFKHYFLTENAISTILSIVEDRSGRLWIATFYEGLWLFEKESRIIAKYDRTNGLPSNSVKSILEGANGDLWIVTEKALTRFNYDKRALRNFDADYGLQTGNFNFKAASKGKNGKLYFGGTNGFNVIDPNLLKDNPVPPSIVLKDIKIYSESLNFGQNSPLKSHISMTDRIELAYDQNDITIEYAALHFDNPAGNKYKYMLENYEEEWREADTRRTATYTSLDPGEYIFKVTASNSDGVWNEEGISLSIIITPPFWQTFWFRIISISFFTALFYFIYRQRIKTIEQKKNELEERVRERTEAAEKLGRALDEVELLKNRLENENVYLQDEIKVEHNFGNVICGSDLMKSVLKHVEKVSSTEATVLILGETGTGKELIARAIHSLSKRSNRPLVKVNCAALPESLIESELFGHEKGAFTGAVAQKIGRFELADGGTIFLDEIGDLPANLQTKLLRVLQENEFERIGNSKSIKVDVRVIAATNRDLEKAISNNEFREDLFYRLNVFPITIPPLRERKEDIPLLVKYFMEKYNTKAGKNVEVISKEVMETLTGYSWPGNIRELENIIERAVILSYGKKLILGDWLKTDSAPLKDEILTLEQLEKEHIEKILEITEGRVSGDKGAAKLLDINPQTLVSRMKKLGIKKD